MRSVPTTGLVSLVYTSTASQPFRETALEQLLAVCRRLNDGRGITGMLLHRDGRFIQVLEGQADTIARLVDTIRRDPRHRDLRVLLTQSIAERRFPDWTMGYRALHVGENRPPGFRDSFADLDAGADVDTTLRALTELTLWFRVRARA
ncbi:Blue light- and temperature-regulated antirepressor YcgF [Microbacterium oxydans]|uniref:Blue light-and temperature-regulated antirepressor YcgF n=1 Tax=Microbacterium oxydans TaxID=82380 RepID=A0A0F0KJW0_9MICO|nr:BLUF domain-containing protein [Microbacterium oxydans]KJL20440.1 Blue light- and temperature-regulated antirepressor YcgF [Microbacterium oxydans]